MEFKHVLFDVDSWPCFKEPNVRINIAFLSKLVVTSKSNAAITKYSQTYSNKKSHQF